MNTFHRLLFRRVAVFAVVQVRLLAAKRRLFVGLLCVLAGMFDAYAQALPRIVVSAPGPRNISYLPVDLIPKIGADSAEGVQLHILHTGGGGVALKNLANRNADFAVAGLPAQMSMRRNGGDVVTLAAVNDAPLFVLMVRADLKDKVRRVADLKGRTLGVNTSTQSAKTTSQQLLEALLRNSGVKPDEVSIISAGQSWDEQASVLKSKAVDAVMGDEPYASRLLADKQVFFLLNLGDPETAARVSGGHFLHAALATRSEVMSRSPDRVDKMVKMLRRSLAWIASHTPEEIVATLGIEDAHERVAMTQALRAYPHAYSRDARLSRRQLKETDIFFRTTTPDAGNFSVEAMVNDRWAGRSD